MGRILGAGLRQSCQVPALRGVGGGGLVSAKWKIEGPDEPLPGLLSGSLRFVAAIHDGHHPFRPLWNFHIPLLPIS